MPADKTKSTEEKKTESKKWRDRAAATNYCHYDKSEIISNFLNQL